MKIRSWYQSMLFCHLLAFCIESLLLVLVLGGTLLVAARLLHLRPDNTSLLAAAGIAILACTMRFLRAWNTRSLWTLLERAHPALEGHTRIIANFAFGEGHFPHEGAAGLACRHLGMLVDGLGYPWLAAMARRRPEHLAALALLALPLGLQLSGLGGPAADPLRVTLQPPAYLNLPEQLVEKSGKTISVYPGTLLKVEVRGPGDGVTLADNQGRQYLPTLRLAGGPVFEVRLLREARFSMQRKGRPWQDWSISLLSDAVPTVDWQADLDEHPKTWEPIHPAFLAMDDIALGDSLVTVNGDELEYAGSSAGLPSHQYAWDFDPLEHINLEGGNVLLQITAYDQDRVLGPKSARTRPVTWEYLGVRKQTEKTLEALKALENALAERRTKLDSGPQPHDAKVSEMMSKLQDEMSRNPILPDDLNALAREMQREEEQFQQDLQNKGPSSQMQSSELEKINRDEMYTQHMRSEMQSILSTEESARIVSKISELSDKLAAGEKANPGEMENLYQKLADMLNKSPSGESEENQQLLAEMEQAQLANQMGNTQSAAAHMRNVANGLMQKQQQGGSNSALAEMFQERMRELQELVDSQTTAMTRLHGLLRGSGNGLNSQDANLDAMISAIQASAPVQAYARLESNLRSMPNQAMAQEQLQRLRQPASPENQGLRLAQLAQRLSRVAQGQAGARSAGLMAPGDFNQLGLPPSLKEQYFKLYHGLLSHELTATPPKPADLKLLGSEQNRIHQLGSRFAEDFRKQFALLLGSEEYFMLADSGAEHAGVAAKALERSSREAPSAMNLALQNWLRLQQLLQELQQQAQASGQDSAKLSIGPNGKLMMRQDQKVMQRGQDGSDEKLNQHKDIELALPSEFQNPKLIEKRLRDELKLIDNPEEKEAFKAYIMELLE